MAGDFIIYFFQLAVDYLLLTDHSPADTGNHGGGGGWLEGGGGGSNGGGWLGPAHRGAHEEPVLAAKRAGLNRLVSNIAINKIPTFVPISRKKLEEKHRC